MASKNGAAAALATNPTTPVSGNAAAAQQDSTAATTQRKVRTFEDLKAAALKDPNVNKIAFDAFVNMHTAGSAAGIASMVSGALAGMRSLVKELDTAADSTDHAAAWSAMVLDEVSHAEHVKTINALIAKLHASMSVYNATNATNMRLVYTDSTRESAVPFIGYTQRKRATPTTDDTWSWAILCKRLWARGDRAILMPVSGITGKRELLPLVDPSLLTDDDDDAIIMADDGKTRMTVNAARAQIRVIDGSSRPINASVSHGCRRQVWTQDGSQTLEVAYDALDAAAHETATTAQPST